MPFQLEDRMCMQILEKAHDAVVLADRYGFIRFWNLGAVEIFGFSAEEAMGRNLDIIIPEKLRDRHQEGYFKVMRTGSTRYGSTLLAVPALRKDGSRISIEFRIVLLESPPGEICGAVAFIRDVTERWKELKALKEKIAKCVSTP